MVSPTNYNLRANEGFLVFLTSKLIPCFCDGFTSITKSQSIAYLFNGSEHIYIYIYIYMILDLQDEVHSIWVVWTEWPSGIQGQIILEVRRSEQGAWASYGQ
jgi:hypothetical protein